MLSPAGLLLVAALLAPQAQSDWASNFLEGHRALESGQLKEARASLDEALAVLPEHGPTAWALACVAAREGNKAAAFVWLEQCVEWGGGEVALLEWDPDLHSLRSDSRFDSVRSRIRSTESERLSQPLIAQICGEEGSVRSYSVGSPLVGLHSDTLYDFTARETVTTFGRLGDDGYEIVASEDGRWIVIESSYVNSSSNNSNWVRVCDAITGADLLTLDIPNGAGIDRMEFSRDSSRFLIQFGSGASLWVLNTADWRRVESLSSNGRTGFSSGYTRAKFATASGDVFCYSHLGSLYFHEVGGKSVAIGNFDRNDEIGASVESGLIFIKHNTRSSVDLYDVVSRSQLDSLEFGKARIASAGFVGSGEALSTLATIDSDDHLQFWNAKSGKAIRSRSLSIEGWPYLRTSSKSPYVVVNSTAGWMHVVDGRTGETSWSQDAAYVTAISPDGLRVMARDSDGTVTIRALGTGQLLSNLKPKRLELASVSHPMASEVWTGTSDGRLLRIDTETGRKLDSWAVGTEGIVAIEFSPDGSLAAVLDRMNVIHVFNANRGEVQAVFDVARRNIQYELSEESGWRAPHIDFAPDGRTVLFAAYAEDRWSGFDLHVFDSEDARPIYSTKVPRGYSRTWCWRPDSGELAIAQPGGKVLVLEPATGASTMQPFSVEGEVETLAFEPSGQRLWIVNDSRDVAIINCVDRIVVQAFDLDRFGFWGEFEGVRLVFREQDGLPIATSGGLAVVLLIDVAKPANSKILAGGESGNPAVLKCQFGESGKLAYVWGQSDGYRTAIIDVETGRGRTDVDGLYSLLPMAGEKFVGAVGKRGLEMFALEPEMKLRWSRLELPDDGWLLRSISGHVDGSLRAIQSAQIETKTFSSALDALAPIMLDPKRVRAGAAGISLSSVEAPLIPQLSCRVKLQRALELEAEELTRTIVLDAVRGGDLRGFEVRINGVVEMLAGEQNERNGQSLKLELVRPTGGSSNHYRVRAVATSGVCSRALYLTVTSAD